jgi:hypothetical protein
MILSPGPWFHDYLALPEIIEDICRACATAFGLDLATRFHTVSVPCVVTYVAPMSAGNGATETAFWYVYQELHSRPLSDYASWSDNAADRGGVKPGEVARVDLFGES